MIELEKMLKDLHLLSGLNMSIFDLNQNLLASYPHKKSKFCNEIGKNKKSYQHCLDCDYKAMEHVKESGELYIYKCHFGLNEAIMPLYSYGVLTGYLMMGQAVIGTYRNYSEIIEKSKEEIELEKQMTAAKMVLSERDAVEKDKQTIAQKQYQIRQDKQQLMQAQATLQRQQKALSEEREKLKYVAKSQARYEAEKLLSERGYVRKGNPAQQRLMQAQMQAQAVKERNKNNDFDLER